MDLKSNSNYLNTRQTMERLDYKAQYSVIQLIEKSILPNAFKHKGIWQIPLTDIENLEKKRAEALDTKQVAIRLNLKSSQPVTDMIRKGIFPNAFKDDLARWRVPLKDIEKYMEGNNTKNHVDVIEATNVLGYKSISTVRSYLRMGNLPNSFKYKGKWWIHKEDLEALRQSISDRNLNKRTRKQDKKKPIKEKMKGYLNTSDIQKELNITLHQAANLVRKGIFSDTIKYQGRWWVPKYSFENYLNDKKKIKKAKQNTLSTEETAKRLGYASSLSINSLINKDDKFPNAFQEKYIWHIPISDIEAFEKEREESTKKIKYTPEVAFSQIEKFVGTIEVSEHLHETKKLFLQYCLLQINNMNGSTRYRRDRVLLFKRFYNRVVSTISNEVFLISTKEITEMLHENSSYRIGEKKLLISFLRYVYAQKDIEPDLQFSLVTTKDRADDKEIYSPKLFHEIYQYVKLVETHTNYALKNKSYANMWVYTILLLTDFIRGQDLIMNTPNIDLEAFNITSHDWFFDNELSDHQAQSIINQLYLHFRYQRTSKTDDLLTFIVAPDLVKPLAYALAISELHRRIDQSNILLDTFLEGKFNTIKTSGKLSHKSFFNQMKDRSDFDFHSRKMNRSVATYLFYSIAEEDGQDSDLALHLTQVSRSHRSPDSTSRYIQATNKDGSINRVSYNLFKRGHFGWLYNYLILYVSQFQNNQSSIEQRSKLIEEIRNEFSPTNLENVAEYVHNSLIPVPLKSKFDNMKTFLHNIYKKRQTVISKLKEYSKAEIRDIITKLSNGDLPSKNENAQCLVYPNCIKPELANCFSCEYVIPGNLMLIQLNEELNRLINNLQTATNEIIIQRESKFLMHTLLIWKEARLAFGDEKVNAYIPAKTKWKEIEQVAHEIYFE